MSLMPSSAKCQLEQMVAFVTTTKNEKEGGGTTVTIGGGMAVLSVTVAVVGAIIVLYRWTTTFLYGSNFEF